MGKVQSVALGVVLLISSLTAFAETDTSYDFLNYTYLVKDGKIVGRGMLDTDVPRFNELEQNQNQFRDYPGFLDYLLKRAPSLKEHFVLINRSQSQQISSPEFPRVILFDGGVALSVSEHPANREKRVEMWEMDKKTYEISMHEITFTDKGPQFNEHPASCTACHGVTPKPLWAPYDFWPNAYGSAIGAFSTKQEASAYGQLFTSRDKSEILKRVDMVADFGMGHEENTAFTQYIYNINGMRWMKNAISKDLPQGFIYPLLATLNGCTDDVSDTGDPQKKRILQYFRTNEQKTISDRMNAIDTDLTAAKKHLDDYQDKILTGIFPNPEFTNKIDHNRITQDGTNNAILRTMLDFAGINAADLSPNHTGNDFSLSTPSFYPVDLESVLYDTHPELFHGLKVKTYAFAGMDHDGWIQVDCDEVKKKSLAATRDLKSVSKFRGYQQIQTDRPVLSRCTKCHVEGMNALAPAIPFDDTLAFATRLRDPKEGLRAKIEAKIKGGLMPPGAPLNAQEISAMEAFLDEIQ